MGIPTYYGKANQWKKNESKISLLLSTPTKPSHKSRLFKPQTPKKKFINNSHSSDSAQKLIPKDVDLLQKKSKAYSIIKNTFGELSYPWQQNLCWLDTSLQLLYISIYGLFMEFQEAIDTLHNGSPLSKVFEHFQYCFKKDHDSTWFSQECNTLQSTLCAHQIIENEFGFQSLFVSNFSYINKGYQHVL